MVCPAQGISLEKANISSAPNMHIFMQITRAESYVFHCFSGFFLLFLASLAQGLSLHILPSFLGN